MYKVFLYISLLTLPLFIVWVGVESLQVKVVLGIIWFTILIPQIRKKLYNSIVIRKIKVALYCSLIFTLLSPFTDIKAFSDTGFGILWLIFFFTLLVYLIYGLPVSIVSDLITKKLKTSRFYASGLLHIGFGLVTYFFGLELLLATMCSLVFFLIDELLRLRKVHYRTS